MIARLLGRLRCKLAGKHLRGKLVHQDQTHKTFQCRRCDRKTTYPVKAKA